MIRPIDGTLTRTPSPGQMKLLSNNNEGALFITKTSSIGTSQIR